jgi:predicted DNA-binding transcriptional regulator AlpA
MSERLLDIEGVKAKTSLGKTSIYELEGKGMFPRRRTIPGTTGRVGWLESEIDAWIAGLPVVGQQRAA